MVSTNFETGKEDGVTQVEDIRPFMGCCCMITSLYLLFPDCLGYYNNCTFICFEGKCKGCKPSEKEENLCIIGEYACNLVKPTTFLKNVSQCCCFDSRCAIPCDKDVPCLVNLFGFNCVYKCKCATACCAQIADLEAK